MANLWTSDALVDWQRALKSYENVIAQQGAKRLPELDRWYRDELPATIAARQPAYGQTPAAKPGPGARPRKL